MATPNQRKRGGPRGEHGKEESAPLEFEEEDDDDFVVGMPASLTDTSDSSTECTYIKSSLGFLE
jgi:hypothetical protein